MIPSPDRHDLLRVTPAGWIALQEQQPAVARLDGVRFWRARGLPVMARRTQPGDPAGDVPVAIALPPRFGGLRLAFSLPPGAIGATLPPVRPADLLPDPLLPGPLVPGPLVPGPLLPGLLLSDPLLPDPLLPGPLLSDPVLPNPMLSGPLPSGPLLPPCWRDRLRAVEALAGLHATQPALFGSLLWQHLTGLPCLRDGSDLDLCWRFGPEHGAGIERLLAALSALDAEPGPRLDGEIVVAGTGAVSWRELASGRDELLLRTMAGVRLVSREGFLRRSGAVAC